LLRENLNHKRYDEEEEEDESEDEVEGLVEGIEATKLTS
jgi:hypothetical protein